MTSTRGLYSVLVVDERPMVAGCLLVEPLRDAGYDVAVATTFEAAKQRLAARPPNLLIAASRLGPSTACTWWCGHLRSSDDGGDSHGVTSESVLEAEASAYGAACVLTPETSAELLELHRARLPRSQCSEGFTCVARRFQPSVGSAKALAERGNAVSFRAEGQQHIPGRRPNAP